MSMKRKGSVKGRQKSSKGTPVSLFPQRPMPQHFVDLGDRVQVVWDLLKVPDKAVVALVGLGGIGGEGLQPLDIYHCGVCMVVAELQLTSLWYQKHRRILPVFCCPLTFVCFCLSEDSP